MKKIIKVGENIGIAKQVQGKIIEATPHPRFKGLWQFEFCGEKWMASNYAFKDEE